MKRSITDPERKRSLQGAQLVAEPRLGGTCPQEDSPLTLGRGPGWEGLVGDKMSSIGPLLANDVPFAKKRSSRQVWNKINETNQGRRISLDPLSRTAMLSVHRGLLALRDTRTVRGERRETMEEAESDQAKP